MSVDPVQRLLAQAATLIDGGRPADALPVLAQALTNDPHSARAEWMRAFALLRLAEGDDSQTGLSSRDRQLMLGEALDAVERSISLDPRAPRAHRLRSSILLKRGRSDAALAAATESVRLAPTSTESLYGLGNAQLALGRLDLATGTGERLREMSPSTTSGYDLIGRVLLKRRRWADAEQVFREELRLDPAAWSAKHNLALALQHQGRQKKDESIRMYREALRGRPTSSVSQRNLYWTIRRYGRVVPIFVVFWVVRGLVWTQAPFAVTALVAVVVLAVALAIPAFARARLLREHPELAEFYRRRRARSWFGLKDVFRLRQLRPGRRRLRWPRPTPPADT